LQKDLEAYTMAVFHVNQLIDLHDLLYISPEISSSFSKSAVERRQELQHYIADLCDGKKELEGVGPENFVYLPTFIDVVSKRIDRVTH